MTLDLQGQYDTIGLLGIWSRANTADLGPTGPIRNHLINIIIILTEFQKLIKHLKLKKLAVHLKCMYG